MTEPDQGQEGARTGAVLDENQQLAEMMKAIVGAEPEPLLPGLAEEMPADTFDVLAKAAENLNEKRRARGRPEGSANRRNDEVFDYLEARGFKQPEVRLMEIISADPRQLAQALAGPDASDRPPFDSVLEVLKLQMAAARELMPYKFAKRQELKVSSQKTVAHVFIGGQLAVQTVAQTDGFSLTGQTTDIVEQSQKTE